MSDVPEYAQVASALKDIEREVKKLEGTQKKYQKLHKAVVDVNANNEAKTITPKQFNDLKRIYTVSNFFFFFFFLSPSSNSHTPFVREWKASCVVGYFFLFYYNISFACLFRLCLKIVSSLGRCAEAKHASMNSIKSIVLLATHVLLFNIL
jgi:hypothetical protein